jgi:hypothetical protein
MDGELPARAGAVRDGGGEQAASVFAYLDGMPMASCSSPSSSTSWTYARPTATSAGLTVRRSAS